jgi:hypothetical protein
MPEINPVDYVIGLPLSMALHNYHTSHTEQQWASAPLYQNPQSGGSVLLPHHPTPALITLIKSSHLIHWTTLTHHETPAIQFCNSNDYAAAALQDYIIHELPSPPWNLFHIHLARALASAFKTAFLENKRLKDEQTIKDRNMPLRGPLKKVITYMALLFNEHQYEFLNIVYNMQQHEYELLTPAELSKMHTTGKFGDRRLVLTCTIHELRHLTDNTQLTLEILNAETTQPQNRQDRTLTPRIDPTPLPGSDAPQTRRPGNDAADTEPQPNNLEPPPLATTPD